LLSGEPSVGLTDVDLDCWETVALAPEFLPSTWRKSGREGRPHSHYWFKCQGIRSKKFEETEGRVLVEIRSPVGHAIQDLVAQRGKWRGTATELLSTLNLLGGGDRAARGRPQNAQKLSGRLTRLMPNLRAQGIDVVRGKEDRNTRSITIKPFGVSISVNMGPVGRCLCQHPETRMVSTEEMQQR
jgi:hypothetical protein